MLRRASFLRLPGSGGSEKEKSAAKLQAEAEAEGGRGGRGGRSGGGQRRRTPAGGSRGPGGARK